LQNGCWLNACVSIEACALQAEALAPIDTQAALYWAEQYRQRCPESEGAYQRLMRLYHTLGDIGRMMQAFLQCQTMLSTIFQAKPSATTLALLEQLQHNTEQPLQSLRQALNNHSDTPQLKKLIEQSFFALSTPAQRLAQIAAVLEQDFTLERAALILEQPVQQMLPVHTELERREVLHGEQFVHEQIFAVVRQSISSALLRYLHGRCAATLEQTGGRSERIAQHLQHSGQL
jgi:hypothetical protein